MKTKKHNLHLYLGQDGLIDDTTDHTQITNHIEARTNQAVYCHMFYDCPDVLEAINYEPPSIEQYYRDIIDGKTTY